MDDINKIKLEFSTVTFADECHHILERKTEMRDGIKKKIDDMLSNLQGKDESGGATPHHERVATKQFEHDYNEDEYQTKIIVELELCYIIE